MIESCSANHQALSGGLHHLTRDRLECIDFHQRRDLRQQPVKQSEIAPRHPNDGRKRGFIPHTVRRSDNPRWILLALEQLTHITRAADETYAEADA